MTLSGFGLEETSEVHFGSVPATSFSVNPDGSVTAIAPPRAPDETVVAVTATTPEGISHTPWIPDTWPDNYFVYTPTVTRVIPDEGPEAGAGSTVTILGTGFESLAYCLCRPFVQSVSFGATEQRCGLPLSPAFAPCSPVQFEVDSDREITAVVPPGTGTVPVAVKTDGGTSSDSPAARFTYPPGKPSLEPEEAQLRELMSCVVWKGQGARASSVCSSRSFFTREEPTLPSGPVKASFYKGKVLYATGTARVHRRTTQLFLKPLRRVRGGRYELVLSRRSTASGDDDRWPRREPVVLR